MSVAPNAGVVALDNFKSPTAGEDGIQGQVPKPLAGQADYVLTANGWVPNTASAGTVTSVDASGGTTGMSFSGGPVTTSGTLTLGGTLGVTSGGTGAGVASSARANLGAAASGANTDITSVALTTGTITTLPSASSDIVNKSYADSIASGVNFHAACQYATTAALAANTYNNGASGVGATLTAVAVGTLTIDGYTFVVGDVGKRILVKNEVTGANNGVYTLTQAGTALLPYILTRATDYDTSGSGTNEVDQGDLLLVIYGTVNNNTSWVQQTPLPITIGTTDIVFVQFAAVQTYTAGTGLTLATNQFSITNTGTAGTYGSASAVPVFVTNAQGQVTGVTNTNISIPSGQVTGLGTMSTQNANAVAVTGGTIDGTTVGATTASTGAFTTLSASSTVSGTGFSTYLASPPAIGGTAAAAGTFTTLTAQNETLKGTGQNLIYPSNPFTSVWANNEQTVTGSQADPFSGTTATLLVPSTNNTGHYTYNVGGSVFAFTSSSQYTISVYVKASGYTLFYISDVGAGKFACSYDLTAVTATPFVGCTGTITAVSGATGWYRVTLTTTGIPTSASRLSFAPYPSGATLNNFSASFTGNGTSGAVIYGAQVEFGTTAGAYVATTSAAVYGTPTLSFAGVASIGLQSDGSLYETSAGTGNVRFYTNNIGQEQARVSHTANAVNYQTITGSATSFAPVHSVTGSDANISLAVQTKGTGAIDLAAGSSGVNISNGGTVTAITGTVSGSAYTSVPGVVIAAPTTAGGVQATATAAMLATSITLASGGSGYAIGDTITLTGGTFSTTIIVTVATLSGSAVATFTNLQTGTYTVLPTNPVAQGSTSGGGSGATFTIVWGVRGTAYTITAAGSGYVEQPSVSFTGGGGGSGAAAYATVGSASVVRSIGGDLSFYTPGGEGFRVSDIGGATVNYISARGDTSTGNTPGLLASGTSGVLNFRLSTKSSGSLIFATNSFSQTQMSVTHTASAVNYVQVTGAATGSGPTISAQGSDATVNLALVSKGSGSSVLFQVNYLNAFQVSGTGTVVNRLRATAAITGQTPILDVVGTDTNASMALLSKGTGAIDLAAGSSGVNISNGGTVTALTVTNAGNTYYSTQPTLAISAPTTAGGVQAVATPNMYADQGTTVAAGGTGYTVGDTLTLVGGTPTGSAATFSVATVSAGVVLTVNAINYAPYSVLPSSPVSTTGGTGTGCTLTVRWKLNNVTITNAGSGYVEQPTVTFSGGGGSGAAAYASVGTTSIIRSLGGAGIQSLDFYTPASITSNLPVLRLRDVASFDTYVQIQSSSGLSQILAQGNANGALLLASNGIGPVRIQTNGTGQTDQLRVSHTASAVNYHNFTGSATSFSPVYSVAGSDTNISMVMQPKGTTGAIDLVTGSSAAVNISNGGTVTALTRTAIGSGYTGFPSIAISAPTIAGGVQATATPQLVAANGTVVSGGTGYTLNDVLTVTTSGGSSPITLTVTGVSGGVITTASANSSALTTIPSGTVSVSGGTGSSATFNLIYVVAATFTITAAGSGYVEQPTVTFSGGGGSGAAAYATVGSVPKIQTLGSALSFYTPSGEAFRIVDIGATSTTYWGAIGSGATPYLNAYSGANDAFIQTNGASSIRFRTNYGGTPAEQLRVSHTASAVNYVQVTGSTTTTAPTISSQGSDANIGLSLTTKGTFGGGFKNSLGSNIFTVNHSNTATQNYLNIAANTAGSAPSISSLGTDTDIPLVLQPKGTGALQAQLTDSTATGGNARGANAVDWQTSRTLATQIASGTSAVIAGGSGGFTSNSYASILGGLANGVSGFGGGVVSGYNNRASGNYSIGVGGYSNTASGEASFVGTGNANTAAGFFSFIGNGYSNSGTASAAVTTQSGTMNATTAVTLSGSNANIKVGQLITGTSIATYPHTYVSAISGTSLTLSQAASGSSTSTLSFYTPHGVVVGGGNNQATGAYSFIGGGGDAGTAANRNVASGDWSVVGGGVKNLASGIGSVVGGGGTDGTTTLANIASGTGATVVGGADSQATGLYTVTGGRGNLADGNRSTAFGASAWTRGIRGNIALSACQNPIGVAGVSQSCLLILGKETTNATATVITSNGAAGDSINQVILPNNSAYYFKGTVVAGVTGGGNTKGWTVEGVIKRGANAASTAIVGTATVMSSYADVGAATWALTATADTTNGGLAITFTGQASTTIRVVCSINTTEMTY